MSHSSQFCTWTMSPSFITPYLWKHVKRNHKLISVGSCPFITDIRATVDEYMPKHRPRFPEHQSIGISSIASVLPQVQQKRKFGDTKTDILQTKVHVSHPDSLRAPPIVAVVQN